MSLGSRPATPACPQAAPPAFVALDPGVVRAALIDANAITKTDAACLATVRIECPAGHAGGVEALAFRITPKAKGAAPVLARRIAPPNYGRAGRAAFPGAPCEYPVLVPLEAKAARGASVEVIELSAWLGAAPTKADAAPPVEVGTLAVKTAFDADRNQSLPRTTIPLANRSAHDVDVVLRAEFVNPRTATTLVQGRVQANGSTELVVASLPLASGEYIGAEIRRVELVDWSLLVADGAALAAELFEAAWARWGAVPADKLPLTARFHLARRTQSESFSVSGEAEFGPGGHVEVRLEGAPSRSVVDAASKVLREAAVHIARRDAAASLGEGTRLVELTPHTVVQLAQHPLPDELRLPRLVELEGRAVRRLWTGDEGRDGLREDWDVIDDGARWRLAGRRVQMATLPHDAAEVERVEWSRLGDLWLPARITRALPDWSPGLGFTVSSSFDSWRHGATKLCAAEPPTGPLADELRAAWDAFHRHPSADVRIECEFKATSPGTDGVWLGRKKVAGTFSLERLHGAAWGTARATIDEAKATQDERDRLGIAALDRLSIWSNRDLCREPLFEEAFRGATLSLDGEWIVADGARYMGVKLVGGEVAALRLATGEEARYRWKSVDGALVPVELTRREERITLTWSALPGGWRWPTMCELVDVFVDWGPESLECGQVRIGLLERTK